MKKHRGQNRIIKNIEKTIKDDSKLDIDFLNLEGYFNFQFDDWYGDEISANGKSRKFIIEYLLDTYFRWKAELQSQNKVFYLAIWLHEPRLLKSEIVCAIGDKIDYYNTEAFMESTNLIKLNPNHYGLFSEQFKKFDWSAKIDLEPYYEFEINWPKEQYELLREYKSNKKFFKKLVAEKFHVVEKDSEIIYFNPEGIVWVGQEI
ncbi:hypothetical protein L1S34_12210 [Flavobacterium sp. K77]|uniref:hypothetical protein n=1 Tax=Flavobacterium sp. K77 TaxID=2910676 RepID=UPI001F2D2E50|nr:hypothetical protein [Flavobacterium sp. K77]MCF6142052.1 hypothetical protein [Flavobacterium sp. K77]